MKIQKRQIAVFSLLLLLPLSLSSWYAKKYSDNNPVEGWTKYTPLHSVPSPVDISTSQFFLAQKKPDEVAYDRLVGYFLHGFVTYADHNFARIQYPGMPSAQGYRVNGLEGFARTAPLFAAWVYSGRGELMTDPESKARIDVVSMIRQGILSGTNPVSPDYWGVMQDNDQRIVETADIVRTLWLTRDKIWDKFLPSEKVQVAKWLQQVDLVKITYGNNWILFPVVVHAFLKAVGYSSNADYSNFEVFKTNYLESGWFFDKPHGVDYYNAWGISYDIFWLHLLDPDYERGFIENVLAQSASLTSHLISPDGIPIMGRSTCYRTAVPSPVIAASYVPNSGINAGLARRALDATWRYFVTHNILRDGTLTEGYFETDPRILDRYTGPGSCHWGLRSLTLAYMSRHEDLFWSASLEPLPIEKEDYSISLPKLDWNVTGRQATGEIAIAIGKNDKLSVEPDSYSVLRRTYEFFFHTPKRPVNDELRYNLHEYKSSLPFGGAVTDKQAN